MAARTRRPRLAVWKLASCDGCQLSLLDCADELLELSGDLEIASFLEASSASSPGPYDLSLVEGSVTTAADVERIHRIRRASRHLVTIGACATAGGIQALRNGADFPGFVAAVYPRADYLDSLDTSTPIAQHVPVDFELRGCPVDRHQLLDVVVSFLQGRRPRTPAHSVCLDCKLRGTVCVLVTGQAPCLGPVTHAGCGALCPAVGRGCYGCFGPKENANVAALAAHLVTAGTSERDLVRSLRTFNTAAAEFAREAAAHDPRD